MKPRARILIIAGWTILLIALSWWTMSPGVPTIWAPLNLVVLIPALQINGWLWDITWLWDVPGLYVATLVVPAAFCAWCWAVEIDGTRIPIQSRVLFSIVVGGSMLYIALTLRDAVKYHGWDLAIGVGLISTTWWLILSILGWRGVRHPSPLRTLEFHLALFAWLAWYALPYTGELP